MFKKIVTFMLLFLCIIPSVAYAAFKLPDTGQTKCYQADYPYAEIPCDNTGQDGAYSINPMSYTDNGNFTVTDNNTGLMWLLVEPGPTVWAKAISFCAGLSFKGYSDWRLPDMKELISIIDFGVPSPGPTINSEFFPDASASNYWTATTHAAFPDVAAYVDFYYGGTWGDEKNSSYDVRCVRGGQYPPSSFVNNGNGTVTDNSTGLTWQRGEPGVMTWGSALTYCEGLSLGGQTNWRLPNIRELVSLADFTRYYPAINTSFFPKASSDYYWSSTTEAGPTGGNVWGANFDLGLIDTDLDSSDELYNVRCVRGKSPPTLTKTFGAASIPLAGSTSLTFAINNPNSSATLTGIAFTDTLPAGLIISTPNGLTGACGGGTISATQGTKVITLSGATLAASGSCNFSVNVTGTAYGTQNNTTGKVSSNEGGTGGSASASITVLAPPTLAKGFYPPAINSGQTTALVFTITNPAVNTVSLTGVAFTDTLPVGLTVANSSATVCGGTLTTTAPRGIVFSGGNMAVNSQCELVVTVTGAAAGNYTNTTGNVTSTNGGTGNTATANLSVAANLSISFAGSGSGTVRSTAPDARINCIKGSSSGCSANYPYNTSVTLAATGDWKSLFSAWSGGITSSANPVTFTMNASKALTATFNPNFKAKLLPGGALFATIQGAYASVSSGSITIQAQQYSFLENLLFGKGTAVTLSGGMNSSYNPTSGHSTVKSLTVEKGSAVISNITIK
jgi:uncharacterized repeat protein (TIGR01451 family)